MCLTTVYYVTKLVTVEERVVDRYLLVLNKFKYTTLEVIYKYHEIPIDLW